MEGVFIVIKAWGLAAFLIWLHRRFFERVGRRERDFEARFASGVRLAAVYGDATRLAEVEAGLRSLLGKRARTSATLAGYPWPHYELEIQCVRAGKVLTLVATRAELSRVHGIPSPALVTVLRELIAAQGDALEDHFVAPEMIYALTAASPAGWRLFPGAEAKPRALPREDFPSWLDENFVNLRANVKPESRERALVPVHRPL